MRSDTTIERLLEPSPHRGSAVREFLGALADPHTYGPGKNAYALFGFLWGLPIPAFSISIHLWACGDLMQVFRAWPVHLIFFLHPILFAVVFGAMGTVRHRKDERIEHLVDELDHHVQDLAAANEKLKELDKLKAQFMANVTHELKTPLVAIRGYNESILEGRFGPLTDKQREGLVVAMRNIDRLQKLIEELLDFERIDSGEMKLDLSPFDLVPMVQATFQSLQPQIEQKRLAVQLRLPPTLDVRADREKIGRVLLNLASNAAKFSPDGVAIGLNAKVSEEEGEALITVWDRGPGIPTAAQKFLFTRFWQADGSMSRKYGGTGLGLAISKGILDAHGSTIQVVSSEGAGTMVHFSLPLAAGGAVHDESKAAHSGR